MASCGGIFAPPFRVSCCKDRGIGALNGMEIRYGIDERLPPRELFFFGLQWFVISVPFIVIVGAVAGNIHFTGADLRTAYLQKSAFVTGLMLLVQVMQGHRLPIVVGPSTVLLIGLLGSRTSPDAVYSAIAFGGVVMACLSVLRVFDFIQRLFTPRVVAVTILLIAFTMLPTVVHLITGPFQDGGADRFTFAVVFVVALFMIYRYLGGFWRSSIILMGLVFGSLAYYIVFPAPETLYPADVRLFAGFLQHVTDPVFEPGTVLAFLLCFLALSVNDIGSMQAVVPLLNPPDMHRRVTRGLTVTGLMNIAAGGLGVVGPVNFSLSPGLIATLGCASRYAFIPAALMLLIISFSPVLLGIAGAIPQTVIGGILVFTLSSQVGAGLSAAFEKGKPRFEDGLTIGFSLLAGTIVSLLPQTVIQEIPVLLRPVLGNGFVVGIVTVLIFDHLIFAEKST